MGQDMPKRDKVSKAVPLLCPKIIKFAPFSHRKTPNTYKPIQRTTLHNVQTLTPPHATHQTPRPTEPAQTTRYHVTVKIG